MIPPGPTSLVPGPARYRGRRAVEAVAVGAARRHPGGGPPERPALAARQPGPTTRSPSPRAGDTALALVAARPHREQLAAAAAGSARPPTWTGSPRPWSAAPTWSARWPARCGCSAPSPGSAGLHRHVRRHPVAADRPTCSPCWPGRSWHERRLALHLRPARPAPGGRPAGLARRGRPARRLLLLLDGARRRTVPWWQPRGAGCCRWPRAPPRLRDASPPPSTAGQAAGSWSARLGGLDSTAVCSLAARATRRWSRTRPPNRDPLADDVAWPSGPWPRCRRRAPRHPADDMPLVFAGGTELVDRFDEPCSSTVDGARWLGYRPARRGPRFWAAPHRHRRRRAALRLGRPHMHEPAHQPTHRAARAARLRRQYRCPPGVLAPAGRLPPVRGWLAGVADTVTARHRRRASRCWSGAPAAAAALCRRGAVEAVRTRDPGRGRRRRSAVAAAGPAAGAGDHALPVPG